MLEDIIPSLRPLKDVKLVSSPQLHGDPEMSINSKISFRPFINYLKDRYTNTPDIRADFFKYLILKFEAEQSLLEPLEDISILNENNDLLELLTASLFPLVSDQERIFTMAVPYRYTIFNYSNEFGKLFVNDNVGEPQLVLDESADALKRLQCSLIYEHILDKFYNIRLNENTQLLLPVTNHATGMRRYYKLRFDRRFIDIQINGELPNLRDCAVCLNTFRILDLDKQMEKMPLSIFSAEGFALWIAEDVTSSESVESIKKILLSHEKCDTGIINEVKKNIHALVGLNEVEVGFTPFMKLNNRFILDETCTKHSIMGHSWKQGDPESENAYQMILGLLKEHPEPTAFSILDEMITDMIPIFKHIWKAGVRSYIIYPLQDDKGLLGLLELTSPVPNHLDLQVLKRLEPAIPLLTLALLKTKDNFSEKVEKLIKQNFTALQPSVEWKFAEAAWESMQSGNQHGGHKPLPGNVVFNNVYPVYGAIDIRNSSIERGIALQKDLNEHLNRIDETLDLLLMRIQLPLLDGLKFKVNNFRRSLETGMAAEDELRFNEFTEKEITTVFRHLQSSNSICFQIIQKYFDEVEQEGSSLYRYRNEYEESMSAINSAVLFKIMEDEESIRQSYPHYFEKYKTDGVEYTIYIGQAIAPEIKFDLMYLQNLRLWQLKSMAEVARLTHEILPRLKVPLHTTHLILVHSQPISIGFRKDERRFDVEGAYNIRYEMTKKRLDKVHIKGTNERLTQPGKIAIVYSNTKEAQEYQEYLYYMQSKNLLRPRVENLELEELQGIRGLRALRAEINLDGQV